MKTLRTPVVMNTPFRYEIGAVGQGLWGPMNPEGGVRPWLAQQRYRVAAPATRRDYRACCLAFGEVPAPEALHAGRRYYFVETD